jgi:hypothetical protein
MAHVLIYGKQAREFILGGFKASPNAEDNFSYPNDDEVFLVSLPPNDPKLRGTLTSFIHRC